jgi:hypothetical protein
MSGVFGPERTEAKGGDVFQLSENEYMVAVGRFTQASWLR